LRFEFRINSDEHSAKRYARSGPEQPLAPEQRDKPGASSYQQETSWNSEVMWAERAISPWRRTWPSVYVSNEQQQEIAARVACFARLRRARTAPRPACFCTAEGKPTRQGAWAPL